MANRTIRKQFQDFGVQKSTPNHRINDRSMYAFYVAMNIHLLCYFIRIVFVYFVRHMIVAEVPRFSHVHAIQLRYIGLTYNY